ncbi:DUF2382 domain-containing protein [Ornithinimicrobium sp. Y1694]|uniref:DUF2382 domain-containing protein n=1 Tax=Ornithinimicrobium sp. Y1694 TaxID=3418590 RepID=UPI003CFB7245
MSRYDDTHLGGDRSTDEHRAADRTHTDGDVQGEHAARDHQRGDGRVGDEGSMTLHEERVGVGTEQVETGRVRLRKHVVTEQETVTVPVQREEGWQDELPS